MGYCRYCGTEINFTRTANEKWMPYDVTGNPHFCREEKGSPLHTGIKVCQQCGKPVIIIKKKIIDYATLETHSCKNADITRYKKYLSKQEAAKNASTGKRKRKL